MAERRVRPFLARSRPLLSLFISLRVCSCDDLVNHHRGGRRVGFSQKLIDLAAVEVFAQFWMREHGLLEVDAALPALPERLIEELVSSMLAEIS